MKRSTATSPVDERPAPRRSTPSPRSTTRRPWAARGRSLHRLEGRRAGTAGELLATQYISNMFEKYKLEPKGDNGFIQEFSINEGKQFNTPENVFTVNGQKLEPKTDYYPLAFSANSSAKGSVSPLLREENEIWFWNVADLLEENAGNPHYQPTATVFRAISR